MGLRKCLLGPWVSGYVPLTSKFLFVLQPAQFGGMARPVQRATVAKEQTPPPDTGFSFLASGKTNKNNAFDFVQEEMKASWTRK